MNRRGCLKKAEFTMTTQEAKLILQTYRSGGQDDADPIFSEALELARTDAELGEWFARQRAFDEAMVCAMHSQNPPAGLREAILANKTTAHLPSSSQSARPLFTLKLLVAVTALIVLFVGISLVRQHDISTASPAMTVASFTRQALDIKEQGRISLGTKNTEPVQLRTWLAERGAPHEFVIPRGLVGIPSLGCQSYTINGTKVSLICFSLGNNQVAHLFVVEKAALSDSPASTHPELREDHGLAFATWSSGGKCYVLTGDNVTMETLQKLI